MNYTLVLAGDDATITPGKLTVAGAGAEMTLYRANDDATKMPVAVIAANDGKKVKAKFGDDRNLTAKTWNSFILPFDITVADLSAAVGYAIVNVLNTTTSVGNEIHFSLEMDKIPANTPFLMKTANNKNMKDVVFNNVIVVKPATWSITVGEEGYAQFVGIYEKTAIDNGLWMFPNNSADGANWIGGNTGVNLKPLAAFVKKPSASARIFIEDLDFETGATAIKELNIDTMKSVDLDGWYTVGGVKLQGAPTEKGVYINNGKKIVIK